MASIQELKKFRNEILLKISKDEIEKRFKEFSKDKNVININIEKMHKDLNELRGR